MEQKTEKLKPSTPLENIDFEQGLEKKLIDVSSFSKSINNIKEMITNFKDRNSKTRKKNKKTLTTKLKSVDTIVIIATKSSSIKLSPTRVCLIAIPRSISIACRLSIFKKVISEKFMLKNNIKNKKTI